jgi:Holliday junction resolvasome RuvABC endonuclease subunit
MKVLAFDPASTTGWSLIEDGKLIKYGTFVTTNKMTIGERLDHIANETDKIVKDTSPNIIGIEDTLLSASGVRTLSLLARINGVIIQRCYCNSDSVIHIINVGEWKKCCGLGLKGNAQKWQTLLAVVKKFNFITEDQLNNFNNLITEEVDLQYELKDKIKYKKQELDKLRRRGKKEKVNTEIEEKNLKQIIDNRKKSLKNIEKESKKVFGKMGKEITAITGISEDIADSIGIALAVSRLQ